MKLSKQTLINFAGKAQRYREFDKKEKQADRAQTTAGFQKGALVRACEQMLLKECGFVVGDVITHTGAYVDKNQSTKPDEKGLITGLHVTVDSHSWSEDERYHATIRMPKSIIINGVRKTKGGEWSKGISYAFKWNVKLPIHEGKNYVPPIIKIGHTEVP